MKHYLMIEKWNRRDIDCPTACGIFVPLLPPPADDAPKCPTCLRLVESGEVA